MIDAFFAFGLFFSNLAKLILLFIHFISIVIYNNIENNSNMDLDLQLISDSYLANKFQFLQRIGEGCFGKIYEVRNKQLKIKTALKIQIGRSYGKKMLLYNQIDILRKLQGKPGIPKMYSHGQWNHGLFLQMELLSNDLTKQVEHQFQIQEIQDLTVTLLRTLQSLHIRNIIHQDIKPQNIMQNSKKQYFFIDFGISKVLKNSKSQNLKIFQKKKGFIGTPRYASISAHLGQDQSQKDDIESLLYNLAFLFFKSLPWLCLKVSGNKKIEEIKNSKMKNSTQVFSKMSQSFLKAYEYVRFLSPYDQPNYKFLIGLFKRSKTQLTLKIPLENQQDQSFNRSKNKKFSLNLQKSFLKVPKLFSFDQQKSNVSKGLSTRVHTCNEQQNKEDDTQQQIKVINCDKQGFKPPFIQFKIQKDQNLSSYSNIEPKIPNISKYLTSVQMKNPFFS